MGFWGYGSVDKLPAIQMRGTEFGSWHLHERKKKREERRMGGGRKEGRPEMKAHARTPNVTG